MRCAFAHLTLPCSAAKRCAAQISQGTQRAVSALISRFYWECFFPLACLILLTPCSVFHHLILTMRAGLGVDNATGAFVLKFGGWAVANSLDSSALSDHCDLSQLALVMNKKVGASFGTPTGGATWASDLLKIALYCVPTGPLCFCWSLVSQHTPFSAPLRRWTIARAGRAARTRWAALVATSEPRPTALCDPAPTVSSAPSTRSGFFHSAGGGRGEGR